MDLQGREFCHAAPVQGRGAGARPQTQALGPALSAVGDPAGSLPPCSLFTPELGSNYKDSWAEARLWVIEGPQGHRTPLSTPRPLGAGPVSSMQQSLNGCYLQK